MFGYVRPLREELKLRDLQQWQRDYCGLCRCLGKRYGFLSRFLLSYDMTFLVCLFTMQEPKQPAQRCWCPAGVVCRKPCSPAGAAMEYAADASVLLFWGKLEDWRKDGNFLERIAAKAGQWIYRRAYRRAAQRLPGFHAALQRGLARLSQLEAAQCDSLDQTADAFAQILQAMADFWQQPQIRRVMAQILYHVGRFLYLIDAWDDLPGDEKHGNYNPLRYRFSLQQGALRSEDAAWFSVSLDASIGAAQSAFELVRPVRGGAVVENILYYGLPSVQKAVAAGTFQKRRRKSGAE